jgi:hypothetical protein
MGSATKPVFVIETIAPSMALFPRLACSTVRATTSAVAKQINEPAPNAARKRHSRSDSSGSLATVRKTSAGIAT